MIVCLDKISDYELAYIIHAALIIRLLMRFGQIVAYLAYKN